MSHLALKEFQQARVTLGKLIALQPDSANAHHLLVKAYAGLKGRDRTKAELHKTVELAPNDNTARIALARLLLLEKNITGVQEQLEVLKILAPDNSDVILIEASMAILDANPNEALKLTEKAFNMSPIISNMLFFARKKREMRVCGVHSNYRKYALKTPGRPCCSHVTCIFLHNEQSRGYGDRTI